MTVRKGLFMGMAGVALLSTQAMALPVGEGLNTLKGGAFGLDENYTSANGTYVMPDGSTSGANGTVGMTESISASGGGFQLNLPQPADVSATNDRRNDVINPVTGGADWGARTGAVVGWESISDGVNTVSLISADPQNPYAVTGVVHNLTPGAILAVSGPLLDTGTAPGSVAADGIPDAVQFTTAFNGQRSAAITVTLLGREDAAPGFFEGGLPADLIGRVNLYEGGQLAGFGPIPPGTALEESDFDHNFGQLDGSLAAFDDGELLLTGEIFNASATLEFTEVDANPDTIAFEQSGQFQLDIKFQGSVIYDGGSLFGSIDNSLQQSVSATWSDIPFAVGTNGLDFNGLDVFDFRGGGEGVGGDFASSETFNVGDNVIPEPVTAGLGMMSLAALGSYVTRRRRA